MDFLKRICLFNGTLWILGRYEFFRRSLKGIRLWLCNIKRNVVSYLPNNQTFPAFSCHKKKIHFKIYWFSRTLIIIFHNLLFEFHNSNANATPETTFVELIYCTMNLHVLGHYYSLQNFTFIYQPAQQ